MKTRSLMLFSLLLSVSFQSFANLRAPQNISREPSSALYAPANAVKVLREGMTVDCDWQVCDVSVKYLIEAMQPVSTTVDFMVPQEVEVRATVGAAAVAVQKKSVPYDDDPREKDREVQQYPEVFDALFKASFPLEVATGQHEISIRYSQPLSQEERGYGYFSKGHYVSFFQYELWPLNEWQLAGNFVLDLKVGLKPEVFGDWWDSLFNEASVECFTVTFKRCDEGQGSAGNLCRRQQPLASSKGSEALLIESRLDAPLPDRLFCRLSPESL